jgi:hypothetical protein
MCAEQSVYSRGDMPSCMSTHVTCQHVQTPWWSMERTWGGCQKCIVVTAETHLMGATKNAAVMAETHGGVAANWHLAGAAEWHGRPHRRQPHQ